MQNDQFSPDMVAEEETLTPFDVRDSSGRQGLVKLFIGAVILLLIAFLLLKFYKPGTRDRDAPPRITAENTPFKVKPEEAGGLQVPDQDKNVFDVVDGKRADDKVQDVKVPEQPVNLPTTGGTASANIQVDPPAYERQPIVDTPRTQTPVRTPVRPVTTGGSDYVVQVASLRTQADARDVWAQIESKFSSMLGSQYYADIKRVDLNEKGIYYRTRIAGLDSKAAATSLCNKFKAAGQPCFVTRK